MNYQSSDSMVEVRDCPRIYNLFPLLAGPISEWENHLPRIKAMGFNWIFLNPFQFPGFSGSLYAIKDPYMLHPLVRGNSSKPADELIGRFVQRAADHGLSVMMDLVINHTSRDSVLAVNHPEWFAHDADGSLRSPSAIDPANTTTVTVWGDLAEIDYTRIGNDLTLLRIWQDQVRHFLNLGIHGFRCDAAYKVPNSVWRGLIEDARGVQPETLFAAETLGCRPDEIEALRGAGFDFLFNSAKWWDFRADWLLKQYNDHRGIAPSIAFPETHDTERLVAELTGQGVAAADIENNYKLRYLFAAYFSTGVMMPMGFEYGFGKRLNVVTTRAEDWEKPRFDLSAFITEVNAMKAKTPALNSEGPQHRIAFGKAVALLREAPRGWALALINPTAEPLKVDLPGLCASSGLDIIDLEDLTPLATERATKATGTIILKPLEMRVLTNNLRPLAFPPRSRIAGLSSEEAESLVAGAHGNSFAVLGIHEHDDGVWVRAFLPYAHAAEVIDSETGKTVATMERVHPAGLFAAYIAKRGVFAYRLLVDDKELEDPYRFPAVLGELDVHLLVEGNHLHLHDKLGAHVMEMLGVQGTAFAVWAPNARRISVVGDFNGWDGRQHPMRLRRECGVWEMFIPGFGAGTLYKYEIIGPHGELLPLKADPYALGAEHPPKTASMVCDLANYGWTDESWMAGREALQSRDAPMSIYEVHLGSWKRKPEDGNRYLTYRELAEDLIPYVKWMGFTHMELLPITEYPFDGSWGYQPISNFAPTSRFGSPDDLRFFINRCHEEGIGVIVDWVPAHFPEDAHGLGFFDGSHLYEHADTRKGRHQDWGTLIYNYGRREVANYLLSSALLWLEKYHIDGLRVDAVASMLYLDYSRGHGEWVPNQYGGNENLEAVDFIKRLNELVFSLHNGATTIAEESTAWPLVSRPTYVGGLGFGYKWNMGWMHDTLRYMSRDPVHRKHHHDDLTFGLLYAFHENFILPLSHDEVVHGKGSLLGKMPGDRWQKFANLRLYYAFMFGHPGKKLLFQGAEFGQEREWNHDFSLDWHLLEEGLHRGLQLCMRDLNNLYRTIPAFHQQDSDGHGFAWIDCNDRENSVVSYMRKARDPADFVVVVCNFTPVVRHGYRIGVPVAGMYDERLNTDSSIYGGSNRGNGSLVVADEAPMHGHPYSLYLTLPPLAALVLQPRRA